MIASQFCSVQDSEVMTSVHFEGIGCFGDLWSFSHDTEITHGVSIETDFVIETFDEG